MISYWEWRRIQAALRRSEPLPRSVLPGILAAAVTGVAMTAVAVLLVSAVR